MSAIAVDAARHVTSAGRPRVRTTTSAARGRGLRTHRECVVQPLTSCAPDGWADVGVDRAVFPQYPDCLRGADVECDFDGPRGAAVLEGKPTCPYSSHWGELAGEGRWINVGGDGFNNPIYHSLGVHGGSWGFWEERHLCYFSLGP